MKVNERAEQLVSLLLSKIEAVPMEGDGAELSYDRKELEAVVGRMLMAGASDATYEQWEALEAKNRSLQTVIDLMARGAVELGRAKAQTHARMPEDVFFGVEYVRDLEKAVRRAAELLGPLSVDPHDWEECKQWLQLPVVRAVKGVKS